jgi:hypothetical protein
VDVLPALVTRPLADAYADALGPAAPAPADPPRSTVDSELPDGIPARLALDGTRVLVLAVPLGTARPLLDADPRTVLVDDRAIAAAPPEERAPLDLPRPRLTLITDGRIADTVAVVSHVPLLLGDGPRSVVELIVDRLLLTAGSLRGPGRFGARIVLRWRDLLTAGNTGPAPIAGDPALTMMRGSRR